MSVVALKNEVEQSYLAAYKAASPSGPRLVAQRDAAMALFTDKGLPHRRVEAWHYTDLRNMMREALPLAKAGAALARPPRHKGCATIVLLDGVFRPDLSDLAALPKGVSVGPCESLTLPAQDLCDNDAVVALNTAFAQVGVAITIAEGTELDKPIYLDTLQSQGARHAVFPRSLVSVGARARAVLIETQHGAAADTVQQNDVMGFQIGDHATFDHLLLINDDNARSLALTSQFVELGAHCTFSSTALATTGGIARRQTFLRFSGEHSHCGLRGIALLTGKQHADTTLVVDHAVPHCASRELFKHVVDEEARGIFQGRINVRQHAQKTDGKMMSQAVLLSDNAEMNNKPELEIFADDVLCAHGATCGALDEDLKFYLKARGIPDKEAERLLIEAFCGEVIEELNERPLGQQVDLYEVIGGAIHAWLDKRG